MLNSTMQSRKNEIFIDLKESLVDNMSKQEELSEMCERQIERIKSTDMNWLWLYICFAVIVVSSVSAVSFIAYGYSGETWVIFRNVLLFTFSGAFSYCVYFYCNMKKNQYLVEQWTEIQNQAKTSMDNTRLHLVKINKQLYE